MCLKILPTELVPKWVKNLLRVPSCNHMAVICCSTLIKLSSSQLHQCSTMTPSERATLYQNWRFMMLPLSWLFKAVYPSSASWHFYYAHFYVLPPDPIKNNVKVSKRPKLWVYFGSGVKWIQIERVYQKISVKAAPAILNKLLTIWFKSFPMHTRDLGKAILSMNLRGWTREIILLRKLCAIFPRSLQILRKH